VTPAGAQRTFSAGDISLALAVAAAAQLALILLFSLPPPKLIEADISNDNAQPIAISITPVLKLGSKNPTHVPAAWRRKVPAAAPTRGAVPSPLAEKTVEAIPKTSISDAGIVHKTLPDAQPMEVPTQAVTETTLPPTTASALATQGSEQGSVSGTETDPLKARAADMYRAQLQAWFGSQFDVRGKLPFERLRTLHALASVTVSDDRKVVSFSIEKRSGDDIFDGQVQATLARIQGTGAELPAPPLMYPDMLRRTLPVGFSCTIASRCQ
jgi:hypothetical protein